MVSAFQTGLDYCEKCILSSPVLKCFDSDLNEVPFIPSRSTPPVDTVNGRHCGRQMYEQCCSVDCCWTKDDVRCISHRQNESACSMNDNVYSVSAQQCHSGITSSQQTRPSSCNLASSSVEPRTDAADLNDDVGWFFEDSSDADIVCQQQTVGKVSPSLSTVDTDADRESDRKMHTIIPQTCKSSFPKDVDISMMPTLNGLCIHNNDDRSDRLELPFINDSQQLSSCSVSNTNSSAFESGSAVHCTWSFNNAVEPNSDNLRSQLAKNLQKLDDQLTYNESKATLPQFERATMQEQHLSSPLLAEDQRNLEKSWSKHRLRYSRVLSRSRHFQSIQNTSSDLQAAEDDITNNDSSKFQSGDSKNAETSENKQLSEVDQSCILESTTEKNIHRELVNFNRLEKIGMSLSHGDDDLMQLAIDICHRQLTNSPAQTWFVVRMCVCVFRLLPNKNVMRSLIMFSKNITTGCH